MTINKVMVIAVISNIKLDFVNLAFFIDKMLKQLYSVIHNNQARGDDMNFIISNNSETPIYQQIKSEIINSISNNDLK